MLIYSYIKTSILRRKLGTLCKKFTENEIQMSPHEEMLLAWNKREATQNIVCIFYVYIFMSTCVCV